MATERDVRTLAGIVADTRSDLPAEGLAPSLLCDLADLVRCDALTLFHLDSGRRLVRYLQHLPADEEEEEEEEEGDDQPFWEQYWHCESCCYPDRSGDLRSVTKDSDFFSARQWHSTGMYTDYLEPGGKEHELMVCLSAGQGTTGPGQTVRLHFSRGPGLDFSERDRALITLLRPHLSQAYFDAERRRAGTPRLTPRHWDLLRLVAAGHTNAQIARRLGVSEGTVRKHLENIYGRLQVSSRTAAVIRAFPGRTPV